MSVGLTVADTFFTPFIIKILHGIILQQKELVFVIDGSVVGRGCQTLMLSVLWKKKAIPVVWKTIQAPKGHFPEADHLIVIKIIRKYLKTTSQCPLCDEKSMMVLNGFNNSKICSLNMF